MQKSSNACLKKKKGPLVGGKTGTKFDSAKYELSKAKKPANEENTNPST
jgi:hypothetical protein